MSEQLVPSWVTEWYGNDPVGQRMAIANFLRPKTTVAERLAAQAYAARRANQPASPPCMKCGRFAFPKPRICFWCQQ